MGEWQVEVSSMMLGQGWMGGCGANRWQPVDGGEQGSVSFREQQRWTTVRVWGTIVAVVLNDGYTPGWG